jgi:hypothetical protein
MGDEMADDAAAGSEMASDEAAPDEAQETEVGSESASDEPTSTDDAEPEPASADGDTADEEEPETPKELTKDELIAKMDPAAKAEYFQAKSALKQLSQENKTLKQRFETLQREMASRRVAPPEPEEEPQESPDLKALQSHVTALETELNAGDTTERAKADKVLKADRTVARLEYDLERAEEFEKPTLQARLEVAQFRLEQANAEYQQFRTRQASLPQEIARAKRDITRAEAEAESYRARQKQVDAARQHTMETFPQEVDALRTRHYQMFLPKNEKLSGVTARLVDSLLAVDMWRAGNGGLSKDEVDVEGLVKSHLGALKEFGEEYARSRLKKVPTSVSAASGTASSVPAKPRAQAVAPGVPGKPAPPYDPANDPKLTKARRLLAAAMERPVVVNAKPGARP